MNIVITRTVLRLEAQQTTVEIENSNAACSPWNAQPFDGPDSNTESSQPKATARLRSSRNDPCRTPER